MSDYIQNLGIQFEINYGVFYIYIYIYIWYEINSHYMYVIDIL